MEMNLENVAKALGISRKSAEALDALDGKADKQVKQSIYDEAAKLLNAARTSKGDGGSVFANADFKEEVYNALEDDITKIMGFVRTDTNSHVMKTDSMHKANDSQKITITSSTAAETLASLNSLPEGVTIDSEGSVTLDIDTLLQNPNSLLELKQLIGDNEAVNRAMLGAALKELNNAKNNAPIIPADFTGISFGEENFGDIAAKYQDNKAIVLIAVSFVNEDGKLDRDEFLEFLNKCAGDKSILNREELIAGVRSKISGGHSDIE